MSKQTDWCARWSDEHDAVIDGSREALEYARKVIAEAQKSEREIEFRVVSNIIDKLIDASDRHARLLTWKRDYTTPRPRIGGPLGPPDSYDPLGPFGSGGGEIQ
ncbi:MAG: hypothetical protein O7F08_01850 [Deltaproteobacteria bacterium]|nr:hypothetical protein [Deltaproteobacteria bacterium]